MQFNSKEYPRQQAFTECDVKSKHVLYITKHTSLEEQKKNLKKKKWIEEAKYEKRHAYNKKNEEANSFRLVKDGCKLQAFAT